MWFNQGFMVAYTKMEIIISENLLIRSKFSTIKISKSKSVVSLRNSLWGFHGKFE